MPKIESKPTIPELILKDAKEREENCRTTISEALKEFNCSLDASVLVTSQGNQPQVQIRANPVT